MCPLRGLSFSAGAADPSCLSTFLSCSLKSTSCTTSSFNTTLIFDPTASLPLRTPSFTNHFAPSGPSFFTSSQARTDHPLGAPSSANSGTKSAAFWALISRIKLRNGSGRRRACFSMPLLLLQERNQHNPGREKKPHDRDL